MIIVKSKPALLNQLKIWKKNNKIIALIPTMGNIHTGHLKLIHKAQQKNTIIIVSIFINKMQFNCIHDFKQYPKTFKKDCTLLYNNKVDLIFAPKNFTMYPNNMKIQTFVEVPFLSYILEGSIRPGHYRGVTTIVSKLFNLIQPDIAYFGKKDFQQLMIIKKMVKDLNYPIKIVGIATVRNKDGLALSSRNNRLNSKELIIAPQLNKIMNFISSLIIQNLHNVTNITEYIQYIIQHAENFLKDKGFRPDKIFICNVKDCKPITKSSKQIIILISAWLGNTRLIDNKQINIIRS